MNSRDFQSQIVTDISNNNEEDICAICFEPLDMSLTQTLDCNHIFHSSCIKILRKTAIYQRCPICRGSLPPSPETLLARGKYMYIPLDNRVRNDGPLTRRERRVMNEVVSLWQEAAEQGNSCAQYYMGVLYHNGCFLEQNYDKAAHWFMLSAEDGDSRAHLFMGCMYYMGTSVKRDINKAIYYFTKSIEIGDLMNSYIMMGRIYYHGYGVRTNYKKAFKWYEKPAIHNNPEAQDVLGTMYYYGWGVKKNYKTAFQWFRKGAMGGDSNAQYNMGGMYDKGYYVKKNDTTAIRWYEKAVDQGHVNAKKNLDRILAKQKK